MKHAALLQDFEERLNHLTTDAACTVHDLHRALGDAVLRDLQPEWERCEQRRQQNRRAFYLSAEYLVGRAVHNNLMCLGVLEEIRGIFRVHGHSLEDMEQIPDAALGNGGLGRLAACYLDSAATTGVPLDGYGIRYRDGLFRQTIVDGCQREEPDNWQEGGDPWSVRREGESVIVPMGEGDVLAVPYDTPVLGYGNGNVCTLRLWQSESVTRSHSAAQPGEWERAARLSQNLYPDDSTRDGKLLRLKQQYFLCSASMQDMVRRYLRTHGDGLSGFAGACAVQLNDTHPVVAIPELIRILTADYGFSFANARNIAKKTFFYTNHTLLPEALEAWDIDIFRDALPAVFKIVEMLEDSLICELSQREIELPQFTPYKILGGGRVHMANLAVYMCGRVNGVSQIHSGIVKDTLFSHWDALSPGKICNVTNGVTQRRWLKLCNPGLSGLITELCGEGWERELTKIGALRDFAGDRGVLERFGAIKQDNKREFCRYLEQRHDIRLDEHLVFDVQIKRFHEYKRQLLNILSVLDLYFDLKDGELPGFVPTAFLFGGKAYPGYVRAKAIIKLIGEVARLVDGEPAVKDMLRVVMAPDYNVSVAEKIIPAAQLSQQISTAGTEASGTGNMKLSLNGAVTVGTYDGANIEIFRDAGSENNYICGARVEELREIADSYDPRILCGKYPRVRRVVDALVDGTLRDDGTGWFQELHASLLEGAPWHRADNYFVLQDFLSYCDTRRRAIADSADSMAFWRKGLLNTAGCGAFSSDRAVLEYAAAIWNVATE